MTTAFKFRKHANIGAAAAEDDQETLSECFLDTGDLTALLNCRARQRIVVGRTGSGKTALLNQVGLHTNAIQIPPEHLSLSHIANSNVLQFFLNAGVKLDLFFRLLWRHVFTVELIRTRYAITNASTKRTALDRLLQAIGANPGKRRALDYLERWGDNFWENTEVRIRELVQRIESDLASQAKIGNAAISLSGGAAARLSEEQRLEIVQRGQTVIDSIQIKELGAILDLLNSDVFDDPQQCFYVCVDRLDENWVDDQFRYLLIRSLLETVRDFQKVENVKIIVALRSDLLDRVFKLTRDAGFQEEKYKSLYLRLMWSRDRLVECVDRRVNYLVRQSYTTRPVSAREILPKTISDSSAIDYLVARTLRRPRELIEFFNECISLAVDRPSISKDMILTAEGVYSRNRLRSLQDEWATDYPRLDQFVKLIKGRPAHFAVSDITRKEVEDLCLEMVSSGGEWQDKLSTAARTVAEGQISPEKGLATMLYVFYQTGIVGLKLGPRDPTQWSYEGMPGVADDLIDGDSRVAIHPMFYRVLGVRP